MRASPLYQPSRRGVLRGIAAGATAAAASLRSARAETVSPENLKFLFVYATGGWDVTRVLLPAFDNTNVSTEANAEPATLGNVTYVDSPDRPSVTSFFQSWYDRIVIIHGVRGRSLAHEVCRQTTLTGSTSGSAPDWPSIIAATEADSFLLPYLVLSGPSYPAELGPYAARAGSYGQLDDLITGNILESSDIVIDNALPSSELIIDQMVLRRAKISAGAAKTDRRSAIEDAYARAIGSTMRIKDNRDNLNFGLATSLDGQTELAVNALAQGTSRTVMMDFPNHQFPLSIYSWDSHIANDLNQTKLWEGLFDELGYLMQLLSTTTSLSGNLLIDETVVIVMSEMGRTPALNASEGKDHWPHNSIMLMVPGVEGRVIGGYGSDFLGQTIDPSSGELSDSGLPIADGSIGATLLAMADIDPAEYVTDAEAITALL